MVGCPMCVDDIRPYILLSSGYTISLRPCEELSILSQQGNILKTHSALIG